MLYTLALNWLGPLLQIFVVVVQSLSHVRLFVTPWTAACQASLSITISRSVLKLMSIESMLSNHLSNFSSTTVESISSLVLSFLYGPTVMSIHDHWENHSFDETDLCQQNNVSAF